MTPRTQILLMVVASVLLTSVYVAALLSAGGLA